MNDQTSPQQLKKLTPAAIMGVARGDRLPKPEKTEVLFLVYGVVTKAIEKPTQFDKTQKLLMGKFKAVRASDRVEFESEMLYLPDSNYQQALADAVKPDDNGEVHQANFALKVSIAPHPTSPTGYNYIVSEQLEVKAIDALADVRRQLDFDKLLPPRLGNDKPAAGADTGGKKK